MNYQIFASSTKRNDRHNIAVIAADSPEAAIAQDAANARSSDKLAIIERAIADCARRLVMLAQQYMTGEQAVRVIGQSQQPVWINFDKDYLQGEFDFEVEGGSTAPVKESFRRQMALQVVDAMAPFAGAGIVNMPKLANYVLQYGFGIRDAASFIQEPPPPPPMAPEQGGMPPEEMPPEQMPPQGPPPGQPMPQGLPPEAMAEGMPPTGGMAMPSNIPPEILAQLLANGAPLPNTQM